MSTFQDLVNVVAEIPPLLEQAIAALKQGDADPTAVNTAVASLEGVKTTLNEAIASAAAAGTPPISGAARPRR